MRPTSPSGFVCFAETLLLRVSTSSRAARAVLLGGLMLANGLACSDEQAKFRACEAGCAPLPDAASDEGTAGPSDAVSDQVIVVPSDTAFDQGTVVSPDTSLDQGTVVPLDATGDRETDVRRDAASDQGIKSDVTSDQRPDVAADQQTVVPLDATYDQGKVLPLDATPDQQAPVPPEITCPDPALTGTVYYACDCITGADPDCKPGDDSAAGTSPSAPWRSYGKAEQAFASLPAGGTIAFCRGGYFSTANASNHWVNAKCQADNRCVIRDYDPPWKSGDENRPIIYSPDGDGIAFEDPGDPDPDGGYLVLNLELAGTNGFGIFFYNDVKDVLLCNLRIHDFDIGVHMAGSNPVVGTASDGLQKRIVLRSSEITHNKGQGWLGGCDACSIEYNRFDDNGFGTATFDHNIYVSSPADGPEVGMRVVGNVLTRNSFIDGHCSGVSLVVHGKHDGLQIEGNTISEPPGTAGQGCWGIAADPGYSEPELFKNLVIARNVVKDVGNISIGIAACQSCRIENNVIIQSTSGNAIAAPDRERGSDDTPSTAITIRNNSIYFPAGVSGTAILIGTEGTNHKVVSNAIMFDGEPSNREARACFGADLTKEAYDAFDYNLCQTSSTGKWEEKAGSLSAWQSASSFDTSSVVANPGFVSTVEPYDLSAASKASPLVNKGDPKESAPTSIAGTARDSEPDIGAYEFK